jgi:UDP-N-acetylmuramoyl-L-alanyl-D-glutamate--2,6-diaminopimelate ligase
MKLIKLLSPLHIHEETVPDIDINTIQFQSGLVRNGDMFVAIRGLTNDGHDYIDEAIANGAAVIVGEKNLRFNKVPYYYVPDARDALGKMAAAFYNYPAFNHTTIGITGTNGKTTTAYMIRHLLTSAKQSCSLISTVANYINGMEQKSTATTPDALELQRMLKQSNDEFCVMEVSSHGIDQKRVEGTEFDFGIFTNLTHEHFDYHIDFHQYFEIKSKLFNRLKSHGEAIVNSSCPWGKKLIARLRAEGIPVYTFGETSTDDLQFVTNDNSVVTVRWLGKLWKFSLPMPGLHNIQNALASILLALRLGIDIQTIKSASETFAGVPGRYEIYQHSSGVRVIVDYAHTPDGLEQFLRTVYNEKRKKLVHIFGFRGNKDLSKREMMIQISAQYCDEIILTYDDLNGIKKEKMESELDNLSKLLVKRKTLIIYDRTKAIEYAWENAVAGDDIVITGKGPEIYREKYALPTVTDSETVKYLAAKYSNPFDVPTSELKL